MDNALFLLFRGLSIGFILLVSHMSRDKSDLLSFAFLHSVMVLSSISFAICLCYRNASLLLSPVFLSPLNSR